MKRNLIILLCFSLVLSFTGCSKSVNTEQAFASTITEKHQTEEIKNKTLKSIQVPYFTLDDIKKFYAQDEIKSIHKIEPDYVLIEAQEKDKCNIFRLYNLKTGQVDTLPTIPEYVTLEKIENENYFIFKTTGKNSTDSFKMFPFYINCFRIKSDVDTWSNFTRIIEDRYYNMEESVEAGTKDGSVLAGLNITYDGFEVMFKPSKDDNGMFYAASTDIPPVKTSYNKDKNQITLEIATDKLGEGLNSKNKVTIKDNPYISSYEIARKNEKINLVVTLKDTAKRYLIKISKLPVGENTDAIPYFFVRFKGEDF